MAKSARPYGPNQDGRFALHQRQPRADKLDARQRKLCQADPAFADALGKRVANPARFSAFMAGVAYYVSLEGPCPKCGGFRRRTRDRSCYACHVRRGGENFERMKAGLAPIVGRSKDSHLDLLKREKAEREGEYSERQFGGVSAKVWPTGKLEIAFPDGHVEPDLNQRNWHEVMNALELFPDLRDALRWAGWPVD